MVRIARFLRQWAGLVVSVAAIAWLAAVYDLQDLIVPMRAVKYTYMIPVAGLVILSFAVRALRWRSLFVGSAPRRILPVFKALMIGYLFNNLLPARGGDLVRVYHLSRDQGLSKSKTLATLVAERTGDLLVLVGMLSAVLLFYPALPAWLKQAGVVMAIVTLVAASGLVLLKVAGTSMISLAAAIVTRLSVSLANRVSDMGQNFLVGIAGLFIPSRAMVFLTLTAVVWGIELAATTLVAAAFGLGIPTGNLLFVLIAIAVGTLVPAAPAYVGTFEFFGISALAIVGVTGPGALSFVVVLHAITILGSGLLGAVCLMGWSQNLLTSKGQRELIK
jgi:uncharacterized protein (TIRG00374 family)